MALRLKDKQAIVTEVNGVAKTALSAVVANPHGISVGEMTKLRAQARANNVYLRVVRNTLARRAMEGTDFECLVEAFKGPIILAFSNEHPGAGPRILKDFAKANDSFEVKALAFEGKYIEADQIDRLATLPTYDEAIAKLMATMKEASAGKLVRILAAIGEQKEQSAA
ncbi:MAG: 50S ribosomal protein L10 [Psychromonas sp.]|nr:50S ribosomal protein L10 [Psychromonas sp.]